MNSPDFCRCGAMPAPSGRCAHCDYPGKCTASCFRCIEYKRHCIVCRTRHAEPPLAGMCEVDCRRLERLGRKRR